MTLEINTETMAGIFSSIGATMSSQPDSELPGAWDSCSDAVMQSADEASGWCGAAQSESADAFTDILTNGQTAMVEYSQTDAGIRAAAERRERLAAFRV